MLLKIIAILIIVECILIILVTLGFIVCKIIDLIEDIVRYRKAPDFSNSFEWLLKTSNDGETDGKSEDD